MDTLEKYILEVEEDTTFDRLTVSDKQMKLPGIKHKWAARIIHHRKQIYKLKDLKLAAKEKIIADIIKEAKVTLTTPVLEKKAEQNLLVKKVRNQIRDEELIVLYLEKVEKILHSTSFDMRNLADLMKLEEL